MLTICLIAASQIFLSLFDFSISATNHTANLLTQQVPFTDHTSPLFNMTFCTDFISYLRRHL